MDNPGATSEPLQKIGYLEICSLALYLLKLEDAIFALGFFIENYSHWANMKNVRSIL